jgi:hypothetical protein
MDTPTIVRGSISATSRARLCRPIAAVKRAQRGHRVVAGQHAAVDTYQTDQASNPPIEIYIGQPKGEPRAAVRLVLFGDGWRFFLGCRFPEGAPPSRRPGRSQAVKPIADLTKDRVDRLAQGK